MDILRLSIAPGTVEFVDENVMSRGELTAMLLAIYDIREDVHEIRKSWRTRTMGKRRKLTPEERAEREKREREFEQRSREFRELLERRVERDKELAAERKQREAS